jgi:hypothetical protein
MADLPPPIYQSFVATRVVNRIRNGDASNVEQAIDEAIKSNPAYKKFDWNKAKDKILADIEARITGGTSVAAVASPANAAAPAAAPAEPSTIAELLADPDLVAPKSVQAKGRKSLFASPKVASIEQSEGKLFSIEGAKKGGPDCAPGSKGFHVVVEDQDIVGCRKVPTLKK